MRRRDKGYWAVIESGLIGFKDFLRYIYFFNVHNFFLQKNCGSDFFIHLHRKGSPKFKYEMKREPGVNPGHYPML